MSEAWNATRSSNNYILIVDRDPRSIVFMSMIIQRFQYRTSPALGVGNALEIVNTAPPSLVITELNLKGLSGLDLLHRLKEKQGAIDVPVIIMTSQFTPEIKQQCIQSGTLACLEKPIQANELYQAIHQVMEPGSRRKDIRVQTRLSVTVNERPLDCIDGECATNLSVNGMYLRTLKAHPVHSLVLLQVMLYGQVIQAEARVAYCEQRSDSSPKMWGIGLQFVKTSPQAGEIIRKFIDDEVMHGFEPG